MRYCLCLVLFMLSFNVFAEDIDSNDDKSPIMTIYPQDHEHYLNTDNMPSCDNAELIAEVKDAVAEYLSHTPELSIIENRKRKIVLKNINAYKEIPVNEFSNHDNYQVANELLMNKINNHMTDQDFRICVSSGKKPIYLLIYPEDFSYRVQIINFTQPTSDGNNFSILYTPPVKQYEAFDEQ